LSGGGEEATPTESTSGGTEEKAAEPEKVAGIGDELTVGDVTYTVHGRTEATNVGGEYGENAKGQYLILDVTVKNNGNEALLVDTSLFKLTSGETTYEADATG